MDRTEYLLICLIEECAEVQKVATKCLRFGLKNHHPNRPNINNQAELNKELLDIDAIRYMLSDSATIFRSHIDPAIYNDKIEKVKKYMGVSKEIGILER
jgi:hypothetical protein